MDHDRLYQLTTTAIGHALDGNSDGAADALMEIGQNSDDQFDVYGACCAFAEVGKAALVTLYGAHAPDATRGDSWAMQILDPDRADAQELFATRFIIAYANDDQPTTLALFKAALTASSDEYVASVAALLANAAGLARTALAEKEGGR